MTSTTHVDHGSGDLGLLRQVLLLAGGVVAVLALLIGTGAFGGPSIGEVGDGDLSPQASLVVPAGTAFSIWSVIYAGLVALAVWQAAPSRRDLPRLDRVRWWVLASMVLNLTWILVARAELTWLSVAVIAALLAVLARAYALLLRDRPASRVEGVLLDGTTGLYLGWVSVATVANASTTLVEAGYGDLAPGREVWAVAMLAVAAVVGCAVSWSARGRVAFGAAVTWALAWVVVARLGDGPPSTAAWVTAAVGAVAVAVVTVAGAARHRR
ncbi:tryptophan-rich sensory protein [Thalassiella azotivora]